MDFSKAIENSIGRIPIVGIPIAAVILFLVGVGYLILTVAFIGLILIPYMLILGLINPEKVEGKFPFDSYQDVGMWNRVGFASVLIFGYGPLILGIAYLILSWLK